MQNENRDLKRKKKICVHLCHLWIKNDIGI